MARARATRGLGWRSERVSAQMIDAPTHRERSSLLGRVGVRAQTPCKLVNCGLARELRTRTQERAKKTNSELSPAKQ